MNKILLLFLSILSLPILGQETITKEFNSEILLTYKNLKIHLPEGYDTEQEATENYPLAIVLNDNYLFDLYVGNATLFSKKDKAPKQIIVGVSTDLSKGQDVSFDENTGRLTVNANNFYQFIRDEILIYMESNYRTSPFVSIVSDGYAANISSYFLNEKTTIINAFLFINPSFSDFINEQIDSYKLKRFQKEDNTFYLYTNNSNGLPKERKEKISIFQNTLSSYNSDNFKIVNDDIKTNSTVSAISESIPRALNKIFEIYAGITKEEYEKNIKHLSPPEAIAYLENKYVDIEYLFGSNLGIREHDIFAIEDIILEKENGDYLKEFGEMISEIYPESHVGNYYLGQYYESEKNFKKSLREYKIGYGKMDPANPNAEKFYKNITRVIEELEEEEKDSPYKDEYLEDEYQDENEDNEEEEEEEEVGGK